MRRRQLKSRIRARLPEMRKAIFRRAGLPPRGKKRKKRQVRVSLAAVDLRRELTSRRTRALSIFHVSLRSPYVPIRRRPARFDNLPANPNGGLDRANGLAFFYRGRFERENCRDALSGWSTHDIGAMSGHY